ncbi:programmed cell death protein 7-like [Montipora foliosa]|uniref:programmed cell death protein 7-like n=1 Tax=Montipora foliosa TaxID=591990 RepID=UPI0035F105BC
MADGSRFAFPRFHSQNQHIPGSFIPENPPLYGKFQGPPPGVFSPQSTVTSINSAQRQAPHTFPARDSKHDNTQRFPSQFYQNHRDLQQQQPATARSSNHHAMPPGQLAKVNMEKKLMTSVGSPSSPQFQLLPNNSQTNMAGNISHMSSYSSSPPFPPSGQPVLQNNFTQASSTIPPRTFPGQFSGPISVPPLPVPVSFPPPVTGNVLSPVMPVSVPPIIQPTNIPETITPAASNQQWINNFLKERGIEKQTNQTKGQAHLKLFEAKQLMSDWMQLISELSLQRDKLAVLATGQNNVGWRQELEKAQKLKARVEQIQARFSPDEIKHLQQQTIKRKKKREWYKRKRKEEHAERKESETRTSVLHRKIDERRSRIIAEDDAKRKADSMKHEAGGVLGEVKRKQTDATKAVELLKALRKLREARKQEAEVKGVYIRPTEEQNRKFEERIKWLENVMTPRRELYEAEEKTLRVMLAEEEEEKEKERRESERKKQASLGLSDSMDWFHSYYEQAEHSIPSLIQIRRQWDSFLVPDTFLGASRIPEGFVNPVEPSSDSWSTALIDKG